MDIELVRELIKAAKDGGVSELTVEEGIFHFSVRLGGGAPAPAASQELTAPVSQGVAVEAAPVPVESEEPSGAEAEDEGLYIVSSPMVGTFYEAPMPGAEPFTKVGAHVEKGDTLCIVEAMKLMNEIAAEESGTIKQVFCKDGELVDFGTPMFSIQVDE